MGNHVELGILGPLELSVNGAAVSAGGPRQRALLVLLLLGTGQVVRADQLAEQLWDGRPPPTAIGTLQAYVSRLRRVLGDQDAANATVLQSGPSGYRLQVADLDVDAWRFVHQAAAGRRTLELGHFGDAATELREALDLWRGPALADFAAESWAQLETVRLEEIRRTTEEAWADAELELGHHDVLVPWLEHQVAAEPFRERTVGHLMLALYRSGRQADAVTAYVRLRQVLVMELGIDPSPMLERLYQSILRHDDLEPRVAHSRDETTERSGPTGFGAVAQPIHLTNLPQRNPTFCGRVDLLDDVRRALLAPNGQRAVALHGMGGVGKSQLAVEYAYLHARDYDIRWCIQSTEPAALGHSFAELAVELGVPARVDRGEIITTVLARLEQLDRWLLIFDDAEETSLDRCLPSNHRGHVIITSRAPAWGRLATKLAIEPFSRNESIDLLQRRLESADAEVAGLLAEEVGDLPLALDQAAAFVEQTSMELGEYLQLFRRHMPALLHRGARDSSERTVAAIWRLAFETLAGTTPAAAELLYLCAALDADSMPLALLREHPDVLPPALAAAVADEVGLEDAIAALLRHAVVQRDAKRLRMHRLVRAAARLTLEPGDVQAWTQRAVNMIAAAAPRDPEDPSTWPAWDDIISPILAIAGKIDTTRDPVPAQLPELLRDGGIYLTVRALFDQAGRLLEPAVRLIERVRGAEHVTLVNALTALGKLQETTGFLDAAGHTQEKALHVVEAALGQGHIKVAAVLRQLASVLTCQRNLPEAKRVLERALAILESNSAEPSREFANGLQELGIINWIGGDLGAAAATFGRALKAARQAAGSGHPDIAHILSGLAWVHQDTGDLPQANQLQEQSLALLVGVYGQRHPEVAHGHDKLGYLRQIQGDLTGARTHHNRALEILEDCYGPDHGELGWPLTNLGLVHLMSGDLDAAARCQRRAERVFTRTFGWHHANTQTAVRRLGVVMLRDGRAAEAYELLDKVLMVTEDALGTDHPDIGRTLANLGEACDLLGDSAAADRYRGRALAILERVYGISHPEVVALSVHTAADA